jgi:hypothetical protein
VQTQQGLVTITDVMIGDTPGDRRLLRVNVEGRTEKEFDIDPGIPKAKVIATYLDANEGDYIVLQTDKGMGACSPTTIYVLTINDLSAFTDKNTPILQLSPYLNECMGDYPTVRFEINENAGGSIGVSVFDHVLENNKWKKRRKQ